MRIGFIGLGNMGLPMASNLVKAGYQVAGFDLSEAARQAFALCGGEAVASPLAAALNSSIVLTMLPRGEHVLALFEGSSALLPALESPTLFIDCSTIAVSTAKQLAAIAQASGHGFMDAPVSGGTRAAASAELTFMVGSSANNLLCAQPVLEAMGKRIVHVGDVGAGQVAKICNNMLLANIMVANSEALALGMANGLDPARLTDIISASSGSNWALSHLNPCPEVDTQTPAARNYTGGFSVALMLKDLGLAIEAATQSQVPTQLATTSQSLFARHAANGYQQLDFSSIFRHIRTA